MLIEGIEHLLPSAANALVNCMALKAGESLLVVTDINKLKIGAALYETARKLGAKANIILMEPGSINGEEPPKIVAEAMKAADVVLAATTKSLTHTNARREANKCGARIGTLPGILEETFLRALDADYDFIEKLSKKLAAMLDSAKIAKVTSPSGTELRIQLGNGGRASTGKATKPGQCTNLPSGEAITAPISCDGLAVIDRMGPIITEPTKIKFENGYVSDIELNESGKRFKELLEFSEQRDGNKNAYFIAEFAIGTNPKAKVIGNVLEDEKVLGTAHIAVGDNTSYPGGKNYSILHQDGIMLKPTIELDGKVIMRDGKMSA